MSIWDTEIVRVDGELKVYVKVQNEVTGGITGCLRNIHLDGNRYYCRADGRRVDVTSKRDAYIRYEGKIDSAMKFYNDYGRNGEQIYE